MLINRAADDPEGKARFAAFEQGLQQLGWVDGRNVRIETRWGEDKVDRERKYAADNEAYKRIALPRSGMGAFINLSIF